MPLQPLKKKLCFFFAKKWWWPPPRSYMTTKKSSWLGFIVRVLLSSEHEIAPFFSDPFEGSWLRKRRSLQAKKENWLKIIDRKPFVSYNGDLVSMIKKWVGNNGHFCTAKRISKSVWILGVLGNELATDKFVLQNRLHSLSNLTIWSYQLVSVNVNVKAFFSPSLRFFALLFWGYIFR